MKTRVWVNNGRQYQFPENSLKQFQKKAPVGVCFSGGGTRAMSAAMGQMRAIEKMGLLNSFRYISSVSGGSWAATIYTYYNSGASDDQALLGPVTAPGKIDQNHLDHSLVPGMLAYNAQAWLAKIVAGWEFWPNFQYTAHDVWNYSIGQAYLKSFGLFDEYNAQYSPSSLPYYTLDSTTQQEIVACNPALANHTFNLARPDRPLLVVNSCVLLPQSNPNQASLLNFEYTPLTVGRAFLSNSPYDQKLYGGGYVEPFAFRGQRPAALPNPNGCTTAAGCNNNSQIRTLGSAGWADTTQQDRPMTLVDTTGTSSSAFAGMIINKTGINRYDPQSQYWALQPQGYGPGGQQFFGDGGILENNGIIPMLQRGVEMLIVFINTETKLDVNWQPNTNPTDPANDPNGYCDVTWPALFGYSYPTWKWAYPTNGVFKTDEFVQVLHAMQARKKQGEALVTMYPHTVVDNPHWGVSARTKKLPVLWYYLDRWPQWESQLNSPLQSLIQAGNPGSGKPSGPFENFPNYATVNQNSFDLVALTKQQITLLADLACDIVLNDKQQTLQTTLKEHLGY